MEAARPHLVAVPQTGEVPADAPQSLGQALETIQILHRKLDAAWRRVTVLENERDEQLALAGDAKDIREVLEFWRPLCMPRAKIIVGSERWMKTKKRLSEKEPGQRAPAYTVLHLKAAVVGAKLSPDHVENGWLDASTIFRDSTTVDKHIFRCVHFKRQTGVSALEIVDELMGPGLAKLAARCACGHLRLDHEKERPELDLFDPPCAVHGCACVGWDDFDWKAERWLLEQDELAERRMGS